MAFSPRKFALLCAALCAAPAAAQGDGESTPPSDESFPAPDAGGDSPPPDEGGIDGYQDNSPAPKKKKRKRRGPKPDEGDASGTAGAPPSDILRLFDLSLVSWHATRLHDERNAGGATRVTTGNSSSLDHDYASRFEITIATPKVYFRVGRELRGDEDSSIVLGRRFSTSVAAFAFDVQRNASSFDGTAQSRTTSSSYLWSAGPLFRQSLRVSGSLRFAAEGRLGLTRSSDKRDGETQGVAAGFYGGLGVDLVESLFVRPNAPVEYVANVTWTYLRLKSERTADNSSTTSKRHQFEVRLAGLRLRF